MTSIWKKASQWTRALMYTWAMGTRDWREMSTSGTWSGAHGDSDRDSGSDVTTSAYKAWGALPTETVFPKPENPAQDHWWPVASHGWRRQVLVRLEVLHHDHSDHPDGHPIARDITLGLIQIRPSTICILSKACILFQNIVEPTRIWNKALIKLLTPTIHTPYWWFIVYLA